MPQSEVLCRTLRISYDKSSGTAFTIEVNGVQFLITAKHLFKSGNYPATAQITILEQKKYKPYSVEIKYPTNPSIDIAVMKLNPYQLVTPTFDNEFSSNGIIIGQDLYFLGFPFDYDDLLCDLPSDKHPMPFIKKACLSAIIFEKGQLLLDGHNNPGFSGGPVCFKPHGSKSYNIAGVIASYRFDRQHVFDKDDKETDMFVKENTGIVNTYDISYAVEIAKNWK